MPKLKTDMLSRQLKAIVKTAKANKSVKVDKPLDERVYHMASEDEREAMNNNNIDYDNIIIERFIEVHGNRYDYSHLKNVKQGDEITLNCKVHKQFTIAVKSHCRRSGCPRCEEIKKSLLSSFKKAHGNRYDYSLVNPYRFSDRVKIICPVHDVFEQKASDHKRGFNCLRCSQEKTGKLNALTQEEFINKARALHGDKYEYRLSFYKGHRQKIVIICPEHGVFMQFANIHLTGCGCPDCALLSRTRKRTNSLEDVINHFKSIHGEKYDYSLVDYKNNKIKIKIICAEHGEFEQRPNDHGRGHGCRLCKLELKRLKSTV